MTANISASAKKC